jgi:hypothetical protein
MVPELLMVPEFVMRPELTIELPELMVSVPVTLRAVSHPISNVLPERRV